MAGLCFGEGTDLLETLLGSCVGVAVWDRTGQFGGLAHVVLPESRDNSTLPGKFADTAIVQLKKGLLAMGASERGLAAKIAGGATMFGARSERDIGEKNYQAVMEHLKTHRIPLLAEHIGGSKGRMIRFSVENGHVEVRIARELVTTL